MPVTTSLVHRVKNLSEDEKKELREVLMKRKTPKPASSKKSRASLTYSAKRGLSFAKKYREGKVTHVCGAGEKISYRKSNGELREKAICIKRRNSSRMPNAYRKSVSASKIEKYGSRCKNGYTRNYKTGRCSPTRR